MHVLEHSVIAGNASSEAIRSSDDALDCFAEPVIGPRFARTRWLAMTRGAYRSAFHLACTGLSIVMPGLVPGIHIFGAEKQDVDGRDEPGHDDV